MIKKKISLLKFESNANIGLFILVNDKFCLIGKEIDKQKEKEIENILNVPIYKISVFESELVGVFLAGNNNMIISPKLPIKEEKELSKICENHDVKLVIINEKLNAFGNNLCLFEKQILINPEYSTKFKNILKKKTNLNILELKNKEFYLAGSVCKYLNNKIFLSQEIKENEVKSIINLIGGVGTVNSGSNMISSGIIGNSNGILIGSASSTIEIQNISESLDYI